MSAPLILPLCIVSKKYDFDIKVSNDGTKWKKVNTYASDGKRRNLNSRDSNLKK